MNRQTPKTILLLPLLLLMAIQPSMSQEPWRAVSPMNDARMGHSAAVVNERIFVFGGVSNHRHQRAVESAEMYDPEEDRWDEIEPLPYPLYLSGAAAVDGKIYIFGGYSVSGEPVDSVLVYNVDRDSYHLFDRIPDGPRTAMGVAATRGDLIMIIGGMSPRRDYLRTGYWYNPAQHQWSDAPEMNSPRAYFGIAEGLGTLWVAGGIFRGPSRGMEVFRERQWVESQDMPVPRGNLSAAFLGDTLFVAGGGRGMGNDGITNQVLGYLPSRNRWFSRPEMIDIRADFPLIQLQGKLYAIGGKSIPDRMMDAIPNVEVYEYAGGVSISNPEGQDSLPVNQTVQIYPNPSNGPVTFRVSKVPAEIKIFDTSGRLVTSASLRATDGAWHWDPGQYTSGVYLYTIGTLSKTEHITGKIAIVK